MVFWKLCLACRGVFVTFQLWVRENKGIINTIICSLSLWLFPSLWSYLSIWRPLSAYHQNTEEVNREAVKSQVLSNLLLLLLLLCWGHWWLSLMFCVPRKAQPVKWQHSGLTTERNKRSPHGLNHAGLLLLAPMKRMSPCQFSTGWEWCLVSPHPPQPIFPKRNPAGTITVWGIKSSLSWLQDKSLPILSFFPSFYLSIYLSYLI